MPTTDGSYVYINKYYHASSRSVREIVDAENVALGILLWTSFSLVSCTELSLVSLKYFWRIIFWSSSVQKKNLFALQESSML